ncbi:MAG: DUF1015 domain-containing protein [Thermodesulfovibrionales bacterium]|nr:DUF1015 domain-containing protein [Thermodesulfovibrionales bacterium]
MAEVIPFRGIFYNKDVVTADEVVAPPYDIITPEMKDALYGKSPYNVVRIDFGKDMRDDDETSNRYTRAAGYMKEWLKEGVLMRSPNPCFYAYEMDYRAGGEEKSLLGFFGLVRLEEFGRGIYPHEATYSKPKHDRLSLLSVCKANTSPIFSLYDSEGKGASGVLEGVRRREPHMKAKDSDGAVHSLWVIEDGPSIEAIKADLGDKAVFIADGHHRYETALDYQRMQKAKKRAKGDEPFNYVLMFLANISDGGLTVLPAHRLVRINGGDIMERISKEFKAEKISPDADITGAIAGHKRTFGLVTREGRYVLRPTGNAGHKDIHRALRRLDVVILDEVLLRRLLGVSHISYEMDAEKAGREVANGNYDAAFFLNPTGINDVKEVASSSLRMPPKSTYFYPKLLTGFVINSLKN